MEPLDEDDNIVDHGKKYDFDFHALSKLKRREKMKVFLLSILVVLLLIILLVVSALYHKEVNKKMKSPLKMKDDDESAKTAAYKQIAKYGENCRRGAAHQTQCVENAYCRYLQGTYRCDCRDGFVGDGIGHCNDISFAIDFRTLTTENIPEVRRQLFPKTDELSVCIWFRPASLNRDWSALFMYTSVEIPGSNELMLWLTNKQEIHVSMRGTDQLVLNKNIELNVWTHLCWTWNSTGHWSLYIAGKRVNTGYDPSKDHSYRGTFPESHGNFMLGQDRDDDRINEKAQMFHGTITQFYVYKKQLIQEEINSAYQNHPPTQNLILGWWKFNNKTTGTDIVTTKFHQKLLDDDK